MRRSLKSLGARLSIMQCKITGLLFRSLIFSCPNCYGSTKSKHNSIMIPYYLEGERQPSAKPFWKGIGNSIENFSIEGDYDPDHSCGLRGQIKDGFWIDHDG